MSTLGTISGGASYWPWFGTTPSVGGEKTVYGSPLSTVSSSPWLSVSEKERIEQLLLSGSLVIPPPQINIAAFQSIALNFQDNFNIGLVAAAGTLGAFGVVEGAITLAALGAWAGSQHSAESDLVQALLSGKNKNPLEVALNQYIGQGKIAATNALFMQLEFRQLTALQAALKTVAPETLLKAFFLGQQQLAVTLLQKWNDEQNQLAAIQKKEIEKSDIQSAQKMQQILTNIIQNAVVKQEGLKQPVLSILFGSLFVDAAMLATIAPLIGVTSASSVSSIPSAVATDLSVIAGGIISSALMWAAPVAMAITAHPPGVSNTQVVKDAAKSFSLTLASIVTNPDLDAIINTTLSQAVSSGLITQGKAVTISATFKTSLLIMAMALLYKSDMGRVTAGELKAVITGEITVGKNDFLGVLAKLVNEQLGTMDPKDRGKILDELLNPYDQPQSLEQLTTPLGCFVSGWNPQCIRDSVLASHG